MEQKLNEWKNKLMQAKTDAEKSVCRRQIERYTKLLSSQVIKEVADEPEKVFNIKTFSSPFGPVIWNQDKKTIECAGSVFSENEMIQMQKADLGITDFDLAIRRNFPGTMKIKENQYAN